MYLSTNALLEIFSNFSQVEPTVFLFFGNNVVRHIDCVAQNITVTTGRVQVFYLKVQLMYNRRLQRVASGR